MTYTKEDLRPIPQYEETGIPLLRKVWDAIRADGSAWDQGDWIGTPEDWELELVVIEYIEEHSVPPWNCGTAYCVAGHVALAKGATLPRDEVAYAVETRALQTSFIEVDGVAKPVSQYAQEVLGLDRFQTRALFAGDNSAELIDEYVAALEADPNADLYTVKHTYVTSRFGPIDED